LGAASTAEERDPQSVACRHDRDLEPILAVHNACLCLSQIKSGHICDAVRLGLGGKEYALPS
jgi:hypothetical protein